MENYTNELLDRVKSEFNLTSEYQLAKKLEVGESRIRHWRKGTCSMDWDIAFFIGDLLHESDENVVHGLMRDKNTNPRIINVLDNMRQA